MLSQNIIYYSNRTPFKTVHLTQLNEQAHQTFYLNKSEYLQIQKITPIFVSNIHQDHTYICTRAFQYQYTGVYRINHRDTAPVTRPLFIKRNYNFPPAERETSLRGPPLCPVHLLHQCCIRYPCFADVSEPGGTFTFVLDSKRRLSPWGCGLVRFSFV